MSMGLRIDAINVYKSTQEIQLYSQYLKVTHSHGKIYDINFR